MPKCLKYKYHQDSTLPEEKEVFVFGSNLRGRHGLGAAKVACELFGAKEGKGHGLHGNSYAIPTKDLFMRSLPLSKIEQAAADFVVFTHTHPEMFFFVTRVGCGYAGYKNWQVAPLFVGAHTNCLFPVQWKAYLR